MVHLNFKVAKKRKKQLEQTFSQHSIYWWYILVHDQKVFQKGFEWAQIRVENSSMWRDV